MKKKHLLVLIIVFLGFAFWRLFLVQPAWKKLPVSKGVELPWTQPEACLVKEIKLLSPIEGGAAWLPKEKDIIVYTKSDESNVTQIYQKNLATSEEKCLTCSQIIGGPPLRVNKGVPSFDPTGRFLVMQVEMEKHPWGQAIAKPGIGYYQNIWVLDLQTKKWWNLTNYPEDGKVHGVLFPRISPDGKKIAWAEVYQGPGLLGLLYHLGVTAKGSVWGKWRINVADFVVDENGVRLGNTKQYKPGNATFYEFQDWSPDSQKIMFVAGIGTDSPHKLNIWVMDIKTGSLTAFTKYYSEWNEHATFSNSGRKIAYMSSKCCNWDVNNWKSLVAELYLVNVDGSNEVQLSHFNEVGYQESQVEKGRAVATKAEFSPDGDKLLLSQQLIPKGGAKFRTANLWLLTFQGACGKL